jgi:CRP/FNR family cyclic AMP-dependent transcriptional regulator
MVTTSWLLLAGNACAQHFTIEGRLLTLGDYLPGDLFGAVLDALAQAPADVKALLPTDTRQFSLADLLALMEQHPALSIAVSRSLLRQVQMLTGQMVMRLGMTARGRVCSSIRLKADANGRICPIPNITQWAQELNMARETLSRILSELERRQIVVRKGDCLRIIDPKRLGDMEY